MSRRKRLLALLLALALPLAPLLHAAFHLAELRPIAAAWSGHGRFVAGAPAHLHGAHVHPGHDCALCKVLSWSRQGAVAVAPASRPVLPAAAARALSVRPVLASEFRCYDHRGPPVQA